MDANKIIEVMGGRAEVMRITGLSKGRISQWVKENKIPHPWLVAFRAMKPRQMRKAVSAVQPTPTTEVA